MRSTDPQTGSSITPGFLPLPPFALSYDIPVSFLPSNDCPLDFFLPLSSPFVPLFHRLGSLRFPLVFSLSLSPFFFLRFPSRPISVSLLLTISLPTSVSASATPYGTIDLVESAADSTRLHRPDILRAFLLLSLKSSSIEVYDSRFSTKTLSIASETIFFLFILSLYFSPKLEALFTDVRNSGRKSCKSRVTVKADRRSLTFIVSVKQLTITSDVSKEQLASIREKRRFVGALSSARTTYDLMEFPRAVSPDGVPLVRRVFPAASRAGRRGISAELIRTLSPVRRRATTRFHARLGVHQRH